MSNDIQERFDNQNSPNTPAQTVITDETDGGIVRLYFERDESAIDLTRRKYGKLYLHVARAILGSDEDADECLNDTLLRLWNSIPPAKPFSLAAYGSKIARNLSLDRLDKEQSQKRSCSTVLLSEIESALPDASSEASDEADLAEAIDGFLRALPRDERILFVLRYFYGQSYEELSDHFFASTAKIKSGLYRLRKKLKKHLEKEGISL